MRFDSGPEVFVRVNRNYVLTECVLNENDCISKMLLETGCMGQPMLKHHFNDTALVQACVSSGSYLSHAKSVIPMTMMWCRLVRGACVCLTATCIPPFFLYAKVTLVMCCVLGKCSVQS